MYRTLLSAMTPRAVWDQVIVIQELNEYTINIRGLLEYKHKDQFQQRDGPTPQITPKTPINSPVKGNSDQEFRRCL